ncbi:MAG TPA: hypothetical protein VEY94_12095 [Patescibacteria group bacterium]|nr:hypothetical protein [Patescibacteria group bacterium]
MGDDSEPLPPPAIGSERILHYAVLDESVAFNTDHRLMFIDGKAIGKVPYLAICAEEKTSKFLIYYCDGDWGPIGVSAHDSVVAAKKRAELIYPGSSAKWIVANFTEEDVARYLDGIWADSRCSFCGKGGDQGIDSIVEAENNNARICNKCIEKFSRK